jgi:hypothetical protein
VLINPDDVKVSDNPAGSERSIKTLMAQLEAEGQIEPWLLNEDNTVHANAWVYTEAQVLAARRLGWATALVTYTDD